VLRAEQALVAKIGELVVKDVNNAEKISYVALDGITLDAIQQQAVTTALNNPVCLVSGGPGTGKTTVAAAILSGFLAGQAGDGSRIGLAAPTGKAAARLQDAVRDLLVNPDPDEQGVIKASTVHRLLGWSPGRRAFRFNADNPLQLDLLIVDEVSMIDLELMRALLDAVPIGCGLVLLGDRDQLASVAPGNVMTDLCAGIERKPDRSKQDSEADGLRAEHIVLLRHNYRFATDSGIQHLARSVSDGDFSAVLDILSAEREDVLWIQQHEGTGLNLDLAEHIPSNFLAALSSNELPSALASVGLFRVLTGVRHGPFGSVTLNRLLEKHLRSAEVLGTGPGFYANQLVMATGNDYALRLFNGDAGIIRQDEDGRLAAVFDGPDGTPRWLACDRLRAVETAFATTIHKSQGSEFDQVLVVLPEQGSPVLSRELLYTAVTRARTRVVLVASLAALEIAVQTRTRRFSGLADRLWA
jgi:exodeoxyribonuclease V alpha subunit